MRKRPMNGLVAFAFVMLASSCGSDKASILKADFLEKANAFCVKANEKVTKAGDALDASATQEQRESFLTEVVAPEYFDTLSKIRDLGFPAGDEGLLDGLLDDAEKVVSDMANDPAAIFAAGEDPFTDVNVGFTDYGLTGCAED